MNKYIGSLEIHHRNAE